MRIHISRDPFARETLTRESFKPRPGQDCSWCGNLNGYGTLFRYFVEPDSGSDYEIKGAFCSVSCLRTYHHI